jgi:hypothetical protein
MCFFLGKVEMMVEILKGEQDVSKYQVLANRKGCRNALHCISRKFTTYDHAFTMHLKGWDAFTTFFRLFVTKVCQLGSLCVRTTTISLPKFQTSLSSRDRVVSPSLGLCQWIFSFPENPISHWPQD